MRRHRLTWLLALLNALALAGCSQSVRRGYSVTVVNETGAAIDWVEIQYGEKEIVIGYLVQGGSKGHYPISAPYPKAITVRRKGGKDLSCVVPDDATGGDVTIFIQSDPPGVRIERDYYYERKRAEKSLKSQDGH